MSNDNGCLLLIKSWAILIGVFFVIILMTQLSTILNVLIVLIGIGWIAYYVFFSSSSEKKNKCYHCDGKGKRREFKTFVCNNCDGTGQEKISAINLNSYKTERLYRKDSDGYRENCYSCSGKGYNIMDVGGDNICEYCNGTGYK